MFECVQICSVSDTLPALQRPAPVRSTRRGRSGIVCRPVRRVSAPCLAWSALVLALPALLPVMCSLSGCAGAGRGHRWGIQGEPGVGWSTPRVEKIQKRRFLYLPTPSFLHKTPTPPLSISKIPPQKQKDPYKGSVFCAILALQALKGRNLQKCTPYLE